MFMRKDLLVAGLLALLSLPDRLSADEPLRNPAAPSTSASGSVLLRVNEMAQAAADLRNAGEAFERFAQALNGVVETIAKSLAAMSSEFDPLGYKTAFRTLGQQAAMLQQQRDTIQALQAQEIERLQHENRRLRSELRKLRQGAPPRSSD